MRKESDIETSRNNRNQYLEQIETLSDSERMKMTLKMFELYGLTEADQLELLGHDGADYDALERYRSGATATVSEEKKERVKLILTIHAYLRLLFPENDEFRYAWLKNRNKLFENLMPIEVIRNNGDDGLHRIVKHLSSLIGQ